jgi:hypothetical protein
MELFAGVLCRHRVVVLCRHRMCMLCRHHTRVFVLCIGTDQPPSVSRAPYYYVCVVSAPDVCVVSAPHPYVVSAPHSCVCVVHRHQPTPLRQPCTLLLCVCCVGTAPICCVGTALMCLCCAQAPANPPPPAVHPTLCVCGADTTHRCCANVCAEAQTNPPPSAVHPTFLSPRGENTWRYFLL